MAQIFFFRHNVAELSSSNIFFTAKMAVSTPDNTPKPPQKRSLFSPIKKKPSYLRYTARNRDTGRRSCGLHSNPVAYPLVAQENIVGLGYSFCTTTQSWRILRFSSFEKPGLAELHGYYLIEYYKCKLKTYRKSSWQ